MEQLRLKEDIRALEERAVEQQDNIRRQADNYEKLTQRLTDCRADNRRVRAINDGNYALSEKASERYRALE